MKQTTLQNAKTIAVALYQNKSGKWVHATSKKVTHKVLLNKTVTGSYTHNNIWFIPCDILGNSGYQIFVGDVLNGIIWNEDSIGKRLADIMNTNNKAQITLQPW